jgi:uncharacterized protein involved in exopolysaccharide biosynthesis
MAPQFERPPLEDDDTRLDLAMHARVVWRRKLFVLLPVVFITSITAVGVRFMSPLYVSRAKVHVEQRSRVNSELERQIVDDVDRRVRRKDQITGVRTQLTSREFLESVVRELGLHNDPAVLARAKLLHETRNPDVPTEEIAMRILVRGLARKIEVRNADNNMYYINVQDNDPESAYILAKVITRSFVSDVKRQRVEKLEELFKFSSQQSRIYREKLDQAEKELREFQSRLIREMNAGGPVNVTNVTVARSQLRRMEMDLEQGERRVENLRNLLAQVFAPVPDLRSLRSDREAAGLEKRLRGALEDAVMDDLERTRSSAGAVGSSIDMTGPLRTSLRRRLQVLVEERWSGTEAFYRDKLAEYAYETADLETQRTAALNLRQQIQRYTNQAESQPEKELQLTALQERAAAARVSLETFERTLQSAELSETILATQLAGGVSIVDPPEKPVAPLKPNRRRLVAIAFVLALCGGIGSVFAVEYLDKSFKNLDEIERTLRLHVVGTVPRVVTGMPFGGMKSNHKRSMMMASSLAILVLVLGGMALYERLLRKQHVTVPRARAEEILRRPDSPVMDDGLGATGTPATPAPASN